MFKASEAQAAFREVIEAGLYSHRRDPYMCHALDKALRTGVIDSRAHRVCSAAISEYIQELTEHSRELNMLQTAVMSVALLRARIISPEQQKDRFADNYGRDLYFNWDSRPVPTEESADA